MRFAQLLLCAGLSAGTGACTIAEAPTELSDVNRFLYREWGSEGPQGDTQRQIGVASFEAVMATVDIQGALRERSFLPENLSEEDIPDELSRPDRPLENLLAIAVARQSTWATEDHALLIASEDQTPVQPTAPLYQRTFLGESDPQCFVRRDCLVLTSSNEVRRENLLMSVDFTVFKDYRWVALDEGDEQPGRWAILSRSWFTDSFTADDGNSTLWQSHTLDLWVDQPDGSLLRYQSMWTETEIPGVTDPDVIRGTVRLSLDDTYEAEDDYIEELVEAQ